MKVNKRIRILIMTGIVAMLIMGCEDSREDENTKEEVSTNAIYNSDNIDENKLWEKARTIAKNTNEQYNDNTIDALGVVGDCAKQDAKYNIENMDSIFLDKTIEEIKEIYSFDASIEDLYTIHYIRAFIDEKLWNNYMIHSENTDDMNEKELALIEYETISEKYGEVGSKIISVIRGRDTINKRN